MANYGIKQFNYGNVSSYKQELAANKNRMIELFNKYSNELNRLDDVWVGSSANASVNQGQTLRELFNGFINKVTEFENALTNAENKFISAETEASSVYK